MCVSIQILEDSFSEGEESFTVQFTSLNAGIFLAQTTVFIMDDEPRTLFSRIVLSICLRLKGRGARRIARKIAPHARSF